MFFSEIIMPPTGHEVEFALGSNAGRREVIDGEQLMLDRGRLVRFKVGDRLEALSSRVNSGHRNRVIAGRS